MSGWFPLANINDWQFTKSIHLHYLISLPRAGYVLERRQIVTQTAAIHINKNAVWTFAILFEIPSGNNLGQFNRFAVVASRASRASRVSFILTIKIIFAIIKWRENFCSRKHLRIKWVNTTNVNGYDNHDNDDNCSDNLQLCS